MVIHVMVIAKHVARAIDAALVNGRIVDHVVLHEGERLTRLGRVAPGLGDGLGHGLALVVDAEKPVEDEALRDVGRSAWLGPGAFTRLDAFDGVRRRRLFERALNFWNAVRGRVLLLALAVRLAHAEDELHSAAAYEHQDSPGDSEEQAEWERL